MPSAAAQGRPARSRRSEEHTSELQSQSNLVCRLLLEKKNNPRKPRYDLRMTSDADLIPYPAHPATARCDSCRILPGEVVTGNCIRFLLVLEIPEKTSR